MKRRPLLAPFVPPYAADFAKQQRPTSQRRPLRKFSFTHLIATLLFILSFFAADVVQAQATSAQLMLSYGSQTVVFYNLPSSNSKPAYLYQFRDITDYKVAWYVAGVRPQGWYYTIVNNYTGVGDTMLLTTLDLPTPPCTGVFAGGSLNGQAFTAALNCTPVTFNVAITKQDATCTNIYDGWAKASSSGCSANSYTYLWTPGNFTTDSVSGLAAGTYNVRVICGIDTVNKSVVIGAGAGPAAPTTSNQIFCAGATVADLLASGANIQWYATATGSSPLVSTAPLINNTVYYASQTIGGCESSVRAKDTVLIRGQLTSTADTTFCNSNSNVSIAINGSANNYSWMATQNGTGITASGNTYTISFTASNNSNAVKTDTVIVAASYTTPSTYSNSAGTYAFADTTGSTYLNLTAEYASGNLSGAKPIGFNFNFFGNTYSNIYVSNLGSITFDAAATKLVYGQMRGLWKTNASTKIAYKVSGTAPNRKLIVSFINMQKPADYSGTVFLGGPMPVTQTHTFTANPSAGMGSFQIVLNEGSNSIENLKQSVPSLTETLSPDPYNQSGTVGGAYEGVKDGSNAYYVAGRNNGSWINLSNESKVFTPQAGLSCPPQKDTFYVSVLPTPKVDSIANAVACPGTSTAAINFSTPISGGTVYYKWANTNTVIGLAASGDGPIPSFTVSNTPATATVTVTPYMLKGVDTCFGVSRSFTITSGNPPAPAASSLVIYTGSKTLNQLAVPGSSVQFYAAATGGTALANNTAVQDDSTYYVSQSIGGCESNRTKIVVNRISNDSLVKCGAGTIADIVTAPNPGNNVKWYHSPVSTSVLPATTALAGGLDTLYAEEGKAGGTAIVNSISFPSQWNGITYSANDTFYIAKVNSGGGGLYKMTSLGTDTSLVHSVSAFPNFVKYIDSASTRYLYYGLQGGGGLNKYNLNTGVNLQLTTNTTRGISYDKANNVVYATEDLNYRIIKYDLNTGTRTVVYTMPGTTTRPFDVEFVAPDKLFYTTYEDGSLNLYNLSTNTNSILDTLPTGILASSVELMADGKLLVAGSGSVFTINQDGSGRTALTTSGNNISFATVAPGGDVYYNDVFGTQIKRISATITSNRVPVITITNPTPVVNATTDKVVCNNSNVAAISFTTPTTGGTISYTWTNSNTSIGLGASGTGNIAAFNGVNTSGTKADTATIIVTPTITNAGVSCVGAKDTFYIVVNPAAQVNSISNKVVCNNAGTGAIAFSTNNTGGTTSYAWTNSNTAIGLAASGNGSIASFTSTNSTNAPVSGTVTVTPTFTNGGAGCAGADSSFTISVNPTATVNAIANQTVCNGSSVSAVNFGSPATGGAVSYSWTNNNPSIGLAASGNGNIASFNGLNSGTAPDSATITVIPTFIANGAGCAGTSRTFKIYVNPTATVINVPNQVLCNGANTTAINFGSSATGGTVSYAWTNNNSSIGLAASGSGNISSFVAGNSSNAPQSATITVTPTFSFNGVSCTGTARTFTITVNPTATVNAVSNQTVCNGASTTVVNFGTSASGGAVTYVWTNNNPSIGLAASGSGNIASFNAINNSTAPVTATISVTPTFTNAGVSCTGISRTFTITVNPTAAINQGFDQVLCNGASTSAIAFGSSNSGGTVSYAWTNDNPAIGLAASGNGNIASFVAVNNGTAPDSALIIVSPTFTNGGIGCSGRSDTLVVIVNPTPVVNNVGSQVICNGAPSTAVSFSTPNSGGNIVYNWTNSNTAIGLPASGSGAIASFNAVNNTNAPISGTISVTMTYTYAGVSCTSTPKLFTYTVNPTATVNAIPNQTVCNGSSVSAVNFGSSATGGTVTYQWTNTAPSIGLAANGSGAIASFNAVNNSNAPITATIVVTPTFSNGGAACTGTPRSFTITVNPTAVVNTVSNQTVCAGTQVSAVNFSGPVSGTTYTWTNSNPSIGLAGSGSGNISAFNGINPAPAATTATITVTPNTIAGCVGQSTTYTVTVNGLSVAPASIINPTPIVCANNAFTSLTVSGGALGSGAIWKWYADSLNTVSIGSGATLSNIAVAKTTTYFVRAEGTCNNSAAATTVVQRANLVMHVRQHWNDVLLFDNSSKNYVAWQWYKNGVLVPGATMQQYSESTSLLGIYYVVATDKNGVKEMSCPLTVTAGAFTGLHISLFPNPVDNANNVTVSTSFTQAELQGATLIVSDVYGRVIKTMQQVTPSMTMQAPTATGMYVVTLTLQNGVKYSANLLSK